MRGACIRLSRMMPVPLRLPHNYTPVFFNTLHAALNVGDNEVGVASIALDMSRHATLLMLTAHQYTHQQPHREATIGQQPLPPCILAWRLWCS